MCFKSNFPFFLQINFIDKMKVIAFSVLSAGDDNDDYVTDFTVQYSSDGEFWTDLVDNTTSIRVSTKPYFLLAYKINKSVCSE